MKLLLIIFFSGFLSSVIAEGKIEEAKEVLDLLEKEFRDVKSISADFAQVKKMSLFKRDINLKGRLMIKFPQYFRWEVDEPVKTTVTADGDTIEIWDEETDKTQKVSTKSNPVVKNIWAQIDSWFMGKYAQLSKDYDIRLPRKPDNNKENSISVLVFIPKSEPLSAVVKSVTLFFSNGNKDTSGRKYLNKVILIEKSGDSTIIEFKNVKISLEKK